MAPEQAKGAHDVIGPATDVFGLGAILYECLTGKAPFQGAGKEEVMQQAMRGDVAAPRQLNPAVPAALERICLRALSADPARRHATARALADELRRYLRRRWLVAQLAAGAAVVVALALAAWLFAHRAPAPRPTVAIEDVKFLATTQKKQEWGDVFDEHSAALPIRNGELINVAVTLDRPGHVYIIYLDGEGEPTPLYPWNDRARPEEEAKLDVESLSERPPVKDAAARVQSPRLFPTDRKKLGWPLQGKSSLDGLLILARGTPLPGGVNLASLVRKVRPRPLTERDELIVSSWPENPRLAFHHKGGRRTDLRGTIEDPRGLGRVAVATAHVQLTAYLAPLVDHFDSVVAIRFAHVAD
jgi:hypothetical protein